MHAILAASLLTKFQQFFSNGGIFMIALVLTSIVSATVIIYKFLTLTKTLTVPYHLAASVEKCDRLDSSETDQLVQSLSQNQSVLGRLAQVALKNPHHDQEEIQEMVQSSAREEMVKMNAGLSILEVVISIAPLLGLLGTASGLVVVFQDLGTASPDLGVMAKGIARALSTTIVGVAVAVPSIIAHSFFNRRIETTMARLEVLLGKFITVGHSKSVRSE